MSDSQVSKERSLVEGVDQVIAPNEIKQEPDIKEEPMETGDLVEFPALITENIGQPSVARRFIAEGDSVLFHDVKIEVKPKCVEQKKKKGALADGSSGKHDRPEQLLTRRVARVQRKSMKQHQCYQCGYMAKYKYLLELHMLEHDHSGEKLFPCTFCHKEFSQRHHLQNHMKMHLEEFLFNCAVCLKGFNDKVEKFAHEKDCRIRRYECHLCKQSFGSQKGNLIRHIRIHSGGKPFQCKECTKKFTQESNLKKHMKRHAGPPSFHCSRCRLGFVHQNEMIAHEQKCSCRLYECYICGKFIGLKKGNLTSHMSTHTGDNPFQCTMWPRKFTQKGNVTTHMNRIHNKTR